MLGIDKDRAALAWLVGAWDAYLEALPRLLPVLLAQAAITAGALALVKVSGSLLPAAAYAVFVITPVNTGSALVYITVARGGRARLRDLFSAFPVYPRALAVGLGLGLLTLGGLLAFVVPGAVIYLTYCFSEYFVVDKRTPVKGSFLLSRALTYGWRTRLLPIALLALLISLFAPDIAVIRDPLKAPAVVLDFGFWNLVSFALKNFVFLPWLALAMARAYVYLLAAPAAGEDEEEDA